jgi:hypothetical protein
LVGEPVAAEVMRLVCESGYGFLDTHHGGEEQRRQTDEAKELRHALKL